MTDRSALTKKILFGMFSGLLLGSLAHSIALDASNPIMQFGINGLIDLGGRPL